MLLCVPFKIRSPTEQVSFHRESISHLNIKTKTDLNVWSELSFNIFAFNLCFSYWEVNSSSFGITCSIGLNSRWFKMSQNWHGFSEILQIQSHFLRSDCNCFPVWCSSESVSFAWSERCKKKKFISKTVKNSALYEVVYLLITLCVMERVFTSAWKISSSFKGTTRNSSLCAYLHFLCKSNYTWS